jgi:prepilin-type N-terminal cleavage/methylation domain-containing protein
MNKNYAPYFNRLAAGIKNKTPDRAAFTLIEIICVIMILSAIVSISYPSMIGFYHRRQLSSSAMEAASELATARSLSISRAGGKTFGVAFYKDGTYRTLAFKYGIKIDEINYLNPEISQTHGEKQNLKPAVAFKNFEAGANENVILIIFRADGVPTPDAINFPLPDEISTIVLSSSASADEVKINIGKTTGITAVE